MIEEMKRERDRQTDIEEGERQKTKGFEQWKVKFRNIQHSRHQDIYTPLHPFTILI